MSHEKVATQPTAQDDEIPVPKRSAWDKLRRRAASPKPSTDDDAKPQNPNEAEFWDNEPPTPYGVWRV